ncbi:hypothetical protein NUW58_g756 [Xylaria curta]|uniref:Uncharacterized protein n=2 Tax=Xylaria curta TaxID=42375 RepID=A0ACC1PR08_9PEZI|nr:hypothetical protein NUW58_g2041 [Xylaria curta]KAJ2997130.1 hypothetical protein NUW58_g756 [Xylaria curta]
MQIQRALLLSFAAGVTCAPLAPRSVVAVAANGAKRESPVPPLWDGGVDFEAEMIKRESPVPPLWDGGVDFGAEMVRRESPVPSLRDSGIEFGADTE